MQQNDPTVRSDSTSPEYPEGTHPPHPPSEQDWGPYRFSYSDMPDEDKPDKSTVASVLDSDPLQESVDEAMQEQAEDRQEQSEKAGTQ